MLPESVQAFIDAEIAANTTDFSDLRAVYLNGTLKPSPETSHTDGLIAVSRHVLEGVGAHVDEIRTVDHDIPPGVYPDMREHGWETDDFPDLYHSLIEPADIVVLATPIWLGDQSSVTRKTVERLYGFSGELNTAGQWSYYGKVGGVIVTGNEDGAKHCAAQLLYALSHIGFTIPPQADAYWTGEAGPGPSYLDDNRGAQNHWTTRNAVFAAWNMLHTARRIKDAGGIPVYGNVTFNWDLSNPDHPNPEYR
ncbi:NAD(P)H-dependent oxidoreductase [Sinomonas sp. ASV486]|uniref:flavodoxin family protein n=1 Tax=Sinomonas sp. ASV486 TaxID=3051170 RepID=UPI0027DAEC56|nr:NAD(P)H-dependent oxidoreductase [Sinomonas sp. ASV486]MDQ4490959.1 NAD(P)H-dependent oxidoreductase [Sinomonas sp. ASV486]